ncbi:MULTISPECIES: septum site-determining protein MinC [unclassified Vibrio]|uniref:Probable septum site-determining protein MinC n=1 Tax=Vibrio sp. HB236076 TaxID=3232307 RepID=A0AB39HCW2_9VIBR|nr:septum site-determining protein MinC [Vibrio sp. HB161653]MDP5253865.1 septum site-determining protein MinC [Vibrio sp. HB161653]
MSLNPDLKGSSFTLSVLHLADNNVDNTVEFIKQKVEKAPGFFASAPLVINIANVDQQEIDFSALKQGIKNQGLVPVGITGTKDKQQQHQASDAGLAILSSGKSHQAPPPELTPTKVIRTPIRSGQQIYAPNGDLVILNHVSAGAEVIADGSIHIHGTLRGRAIAGANGQKQAHIICNDLQAELVSIAGSYWLSEQIERECWQQKVLVSLQQDSLCIETLSV